MKNIWLLLAVGMVAACVLTVSVKKTYGASVKMQGGDVVLMVNSATAGADPDPAVDQTTAQLKYKTGTSDPTQKITVQTNLGGSSFALTVEAVNVDDGDPTGEVALDTTARDLVVNVTSIEWSFCDLRYTAVARASDGVGTDAHTVTYTMICQ